MICWCSREASICPQTNAFQATIRSLQPVAHPERITSIASGPSGTHNEYRVKGPGVTTGRSGVLGNVYFVHEDYWPLNTSLWVKEFRISAPHHAYFTLSTLDFSLLNAGSAVPTLNRNHVHDLPVVVPTAEIVKQFESMVSPLFALQHRCSLESHTLAETRDALLPRLISGELRV